MTRLSTFFLAVLISLKVQSQEFGDLITFDEYATMTVITDQYLSHGAIFSGLPAGHFADIYDYTGLYGPILKSDSWYDQIKLEFVDPGNSSVAIPVSHFGYENPIDSEIDYIVTNFYDENDELVFTYTSVSPEIISLDLDDLGATYVVFDDDLTTAYVVDDIWFVADTTETSQVHESDQVLLAPFPNPMTSVCTILFPEFISNAIMDLYDTSGKLVLREQQLSGTQYILQRKNLSAGTYLFRIAADSGKEYIGNISVE